MLLPFAIPIAWHLRQHSCLNASKAPNKLFSPRRSPFGCGQSPGALLRRFQEGWLAHRLQLAATAAAVETAR